jgi:hypothetical protein
MNILTQYIPQHQFRIFILCVATGTHSIIPPYIYDDRSQRVVSGILLPEVVFNQFTGVFHTKRVCVTARNLLREQLTTPRHEVGQKCPFIAVFIVVSPSLVQR